MEVLLLFYYFGGLRLWGDTGTVLGPGFGESGFFLGVGEGVYLLWGFTETVFLPYFIFVPISNEYS